MPNTRIGALQPLDFDRQLRAQLGRMTAGLAPTSFATAWAD